MVMMMTVSGREDAADGSCWWYSRGYCNTFLPVRVDSCTERRIEGEGAAAAALGYLAEGND